MSKECSIMQQLGEELCATKRAYVCATICIVLLYLSCFIFICKMSDYQSFWNDKTFAFYVSF